VVISLREPGVFGWADERVLQGKDGASDRYVATSERYTPDRVREALVSFEPGESALVNLYARKALRHWRVRDWIPGGQVNLHEELRAERMHFLAELAVAKYYGLTLEGTRRRGTSSPGFKIGRRHIAVEIAPTGSPPWFLLAFLDDQHHRDNIPMPLTSDRFLFGLLEGPMSLGGQPKIRLCGMLDRPAVTALPTVRRERAGQSAWYYEVTEQTLVALPDEL
jgi:hypothetical protein